MAQNALELYKYIKQDPSLRMDLQTNYNQVPVLQGQEYYYSDPQTEMYFSPINLFGEGSASKKGASFGGNLQANIPLPTGSLNTNIGGNLYKEGPYKGGSLSNVNLGYNTDAFSLGGEYTNNQGESNPLQYDMRDNVQDIYFDTQPNYVGQNYLGRARFRY